MKVCLILLAGTIQVGCGNRPDYESKRKLRDEGTGEDVPQSSTKFNYNNPSVFCKVCKQKPPDESVPDEVIATTECNINRNPRFVNGKVRSYGLIYTMYNCGIIVDFLEINLSEQVFITLLHWTDMLRRISCLENIPRIFIYDNACSVWIYFKNRFHQQKTILSTPISVYLDSCDMYIDRLHQRTHTRPMCKNERNINLRSDLRDVNTVVCEQTNSWLKSYLNMLMNFSGGRSKFYYLFLFHLLNCHRSTMHFAQKLPFRTFLE